MQRGHQARASDFGDLLRELMRMSVHTALTFLCFTIHQNAGKSKLLHEKSGKMGPIHAGYKSVPRRRTRARGFRFWLGLGPPFFEGWVACFGVAKLVDTW